MQVTGACPSRPPALLRQARPVAAPFGAPGRRAAGRRAPRSGRGARTPGRAASAPPADLPASRQSTADSVAPVKLFDMATLGNLCVDVFVDVERQPPRDLDTQRALLASLLASPPGPEAWEVGGSTNVAIAASRLGLRVAATGPLGHDPFGEFLSDILEVGGRARLTGEWTSAILVMRWTCLRCCWPAK